MAGISTLRPVPRRPSSSASLKNLSLPVDYDKAAHFYGLAAAGGVVHATARLALLHLHGRHSSADATHGFSLLRKAAKRGDAAARAALQEIAERMMSSAFP
ncbi:SEL1-like repeat protein [Cupriavidus sp. SK-3]|uniref:hypothetical protein n=1 Tax=Cupriavidus sp. SK-3 TaxID=1470558 RepID=UPI0039C865CB